VLIIDKLSGVPIFEQIIDNIQLLIIQGVYPADTKLLSVRTFSQELNVNPNTLQKAFTELEREGICYSVTGSGRYVSKNAAEIIRKNKLSHLDEIANMVSSLKLFGVTKEQIIECVNEAYSGAKAKKGAEKQ